MSQLRSIVERIERLEAEIASLNSDKSDIYKEAKANGFDVKALRAVIAYRRKDPNERAELDAIVETYLAELTKLPKAGTDIATRVRAHEATEPATPASSTDRLRQQLQASIAMADAGEIPAFLDRRPS
jgi:uncharacterized protein (UPF0335 family)